MSFLDSIKQSLLDMSADRKNTNGRKPETTLSGIRGRVSEMNNPTIFEDVKSTDLFGAGKGWRSSLPAQQEEKKPEAAASDVLSSLIPAESKTKTVAKTVDKPAQPAKTPERDEYVTKLPPAEQKMVNQQVVETKQEIKEASKDPSMFAKAAQMLGVAGDQAMKVFEGFDNPMDRVDWLTMLSVYAMSRSQGNNASMAIANGLMRGMESEGRRKAAQGLMQQQQAAAQQSQKNKDRQFLLDKYEAESGRMSAQASVEKAKAAGAKDLLAPLSNEERKIADTMVETEDVDSALAYEAANQLKKKGVPVSPLALKRTIEQMVSKGYAEDPLIGSKGLL